MPLGLCLGKPESSERPGTLQNLPWCITCLSLFGSPIEMAHKLRSSGEFCIDYVDYTQMFHHLWVLLERIIKGLPKQLNWWCRFNLMLWKKPASWDILASRSRPQKEILSYFTILCLPLSTSSVQRPVAANDWIPTSTVMGRQFGEGVAKGWMNAVEPAASKPEWRTQIEVTSHYNSGENANLHSGVCAYKPTNRFYKGVLWMTFMCTQAVLVVCSLQYLAGL